MDQYGRIVYLDVQKTGSSYVSAVLSRVYAGGPRRIFNKHARFPGPAVGDEIFLTTMREPVAQWVSLYQWGCAAPTSPLRQRLETCGSLPCVWDGTLEDFGRWLDLVLDPGCAERLASGYGPAAELVGFQTFRWLRLNLSVPPKRIGRLQSRDALLALVAGTAYPATGMRTEHLAEDLLRAFRTVLADTVPPGIPIDRIVRETPVPKKTADPAFRPADVPEDWRRHVLAREWYLAERSREASTEG